MDAYEHHDWVSALAKCSLDTMFVCLAEVIDSDVASRNKLQHPLATFHFQRSTGKVVVARHRDFGGIQEVDTVVFELRKHEITAVSKDAAGKATPILTAKPNLNRDGECFLAVGAQDLRLWQVSRMALEDLFFEF